MKTISGITSYALWHDEIIYTKDNEIFRYHILSDKKERIDETNFHPYVVRDFLFYQQKNGKNLFLLNLSTGKKEMKAGSYFISVFRSSQFHVFIGFKNESNEKQHMMISNDSSAFELLPPPRHFIESETSSGHIIVSEKMGSRLACIEPRSGSRIWEFDVSEMGKYVDLDGKTERAGKLDTKILYLEKENSLVFGITSKRKLTGPSRQYISLNALTGTIYWVYNPEDKIIYEEFYIYNDSIYILTKSKLLILDTNNGAVHNEFDFEADFKAREIESYNNYVIKNDKLYFSDTRSNKIGIINLLQNRFETSIQVETENADWIERPVVTSTHLLVRDSLNTLHIFKL